MVSRQESRRQRRGQVLADLQSRIQTLEGQNAVLADEEGRFSFGLPKVDDHLPGQGLATGALHEVAGGDHRDMPAAFGFLLGLVMRRLQALSGQGIVLWCRQTYGPHDFGLLYGPGLAAFGFAPAQLLLVTSPKPTDVLWVLEEALRSQALVAIVGEVGPALDLTASRRLQLAAETMATPVFLLRPPQAREASAAMTRWRITSHQKEAHAWQRPCWQTELVRCRGGRPQQWFLEWDHATHCFSVAATLADRQAQPQTQDGVLRHAGAALS